MKNLMSLALALALSGPLGAGHHDEGRPAAGGEAPALAAPSTTGAVDSLAAHRGEWVVLYFFPRTFTPGCTAQSCSLRDGYGAIQSFGAEILGVSMDSPASQTAFRDEYELPFHLLSDEEGSIAADYGVLAPAGAYALRVTFLIDPEGQVAAVVDEVDPSRHDKQVIDALAEATGHPDTALAVPGLYAVYFHADWCEKCRAMADDWDATQQALTEENILFVTFDFTNDATTEQAGLLAGALGLGPVYLDNEDLTGFVVLVSPGDGEDLGHISSTMSASEMEATIRSALANGEG